MMPQNDMPKLWNRNFVKVWCANFFLFFSFYLLLPMLPIYLSERFGADKNTIGLAMAGYTITALIIRLFSGYIVDGYPRKTVLMVCYTLFFACFAGYLVAGTLLIFAAIRTLHGAPFGATTVANSTVAIDVLNPERRAEGIGYYGVSNNIAMALGPTVAAYIYSVSCDFNLLFVLSLVIAGIGVLVVASVKVPHREVVKVRQPLSLDRFFLVRGTSEGIVLACVAFSWGVLSTYLAIYSLQVLGNANTTGAFFMIVALGLILSRLIGSRSLRQGRIVWNATVGLLTSLFGYLLFVLVPNYWGYYGAALIIGLGNGHICPAIQNMFINLAPNSKRGTANSSFLVSWDVGMGLGILAGGSVAEICGYTNAFWMAWGVNLAGVALYLAYTRSSYLRLRLR